MARPKRPTAFEVSFGERIDGEDEASTAAPVAPSPSLGRPAAPATSSKRKDRSNLRDAAQFGHSSQTSSKRARVESKASRARDAGSSAQCNSTYAPMLQDIKEFPGLVVLGEDPEERFDDGGKPTRYLTDFVVFEPAGGFRLTSLNVLDAAPESEGTNRRLECVGFVSPVPLNEEDAGQEDGLDDDDHLQRLRTSAITRFTIDYTTIDGPLRIETDFGWYILKAPADGYRTLFVEFYRPHRIAQLAISISLAGVLNSFKNFEELYVGRRDYILGDFIRAEDLQDAVPIVRALVDDKSIIRDISRHPIVKHLVTAAYIQAPYPQQNPQIHPAQHRLQPRILDGAIGNVDLAVLRPENQNPTCVTPFVDALALGLFHERLQVIGPPPRRPGEHELQRRQKVVQARLQALLHAALRYRTGNDKADISFPAAYRLHDEYWNAVKINNEIFKVGDCIIVEAGTYKHREIRAIPLDLDELPKDAQLADYFWFAKIVSINQQRKRLHVQWYEHSSKTFLQEISDPRELFLCPLCSDIKLGAVQVLGKAVVHHAPDQIGDMKPNEFFSRFMYNEAEGTFTDIDRTTSEVLSSNQPPENCPSCLLAAHHSQEQVCDATESMISYLGVTYHKDDYALFCSNQGPATIGRISCIRLRKKSSPILSVQLLGRMLDIVPSLPKGYFLDEHELFMTSMYKEVDARDLLQQCVVLHCSAVEDLQSWTTLSPLHYYVKYCFPTLQPSWDSRTELKACQLPVCLECYQEDNAKIKAVGHLPCLRAFDPFAGVGAFALAMEETGCVKLTHAVEISPSAADTLRKNCPSVKVFNQCSNVVLQHAVKSHAGQVLGPLRDLEDKGDLPSPPQPGQIDCIITGFPCQPHSSLNMYQRVNDRKSHLILNLLSWVDFLRPKYCFFENVKGFLKYHLQASQAGKYKVEGGIPMGGVKFLVNALVAMGYQTRIALLQAGHYGTPQRRIRFFLIASQQGYPLPLFPQPTHNSIEAHTLEITFPNSISIRPILTAEGTAPFKHVSIEDAIGDLLPYDWENPKKLKQTAIHPPRYMTVKCKGKSYSHCGPDGDYAHKPRTSYQRKVRERPTEAIQHFTRILKPEVVERVINVKLEAGADYRGFDAPLLEWLSSHPTSAVARKGFFPGYYGRLDKAAWFHATMTNVEPTAKQSYVVHPWCQRVLSVRELARSQGFPDWFVFVAREDRVKTMQRQIGNAVPWPLARALGRELGEAMLKKRLQSRTETIDLSVDQ